MQEEISALCEKARQSLDAAETLLKGGFPGFAYAMFYVAEALLLDKGLAFSKHSGVIASFGEHFAKTKAMDAKYHRYLIEGHEQRQIGDYETLEKVSASAAMVIIERGKEFLSAALQELKKQGGI